MRIARVEGRFEPAPARRSAAAAGGIVASAHGEATAAGAEMLEQGGNAADAACATGFALGVCEPQGSGLGGQSIGLVHFDGTTLAYDGSSRAPSLAHHERLNGTDRRLGYRASTVPSTPAVFAWLHRKHGRLPWAIVLEPAIRLAREGYKITELQHQLQVRELEKFLAVPSRSGARYFLNDACRPYEPGDTFRQSQLADVLSTIARRGVETFYQGDIAAQVDADMRAHDGFLRADDLALIPWPVERRPLRRRYRGVTIESMPPPGAGRILLLVMMMLASVRSDFLRGSTYERNHYLAETFRKAFLRRVDRPFDPNTYDQIRNKTLLSRSYAHALASSIAETIDPELPWADPAGADVDETTHFCVMDAAGNTVSMTQSVELVYGSKTAADGLGFLYNNYLNAFETQDPSHPYFLRPNAVPWSSAAPTIVVRGGRPWLALGSPGSERIFSTLAQFLVHVVDGSRSIDEAMLAPRLHCSIGGRVSLEAGRFPEGTVEHLESKGYRVKPRDDFAFYLGCVQAVLRRETGPGFQGVADVRRDGTAAGPT